MRERDFPVDETDENLQGLYEWAVHVYRREKSTELPCRERSDVFVDPDGHSSVILLRDTAGCELGFYRANCRGIRRAG